MRPKRPSRKFSQENLSLMRASGLGVRQCMERAFEDARVIGYEQFLLICANLPDSGDAHLLAAAVKTQAAMIVTENLKDFPGDVLEALNIEARSVDGFIADTIALNPGRAFAAIRKMRERFKKPEKSADILLLDMEAEGLVETVYILRAHVQSL